MTEDFHNSTMVLPASDFATDEMLIEDTGETNMLTVHNVLASAVLYGAERLDLDKCCLLLGNSYYNPAEFPALRVDVRGRSNAIYTISLFESGRIQSAGGCRPMEARRAMMKIGRRLNEKLNYGIKLQNFEIQNILAVFDACSQVNLNTFVATFNGVVDYEPDRFPAARVRIPIPKKKTGVESSDKLDSSDQRASVKLRKLMMGESSPESDFTHTAASSGVGSYMVGAGSKRAAPTRQRDEKQNKEEVVTANVFSTGKITFTGAKSISSLNFALEKLKPAIGLRTISVCTRLYPPTMGFTDMMQQSTAFYPPRMIPPSMTVNQSHPFLNAMPHSHFQQTQPFSPFVHQMSSLMTTPAQPGSLAARTQVLLQQEQQYDQQPLRAFMSSPTFHQFAPLRTT